MNDPQDRYIPSLIWNVFIKSYHEFNLILNKVRIFKKKNKKNKKAHTHKIWYTLHVYMVMRRLNILCIHKRSLKMIPKGGNQNPYIEEGQTMA